MFTFLPTLVAGCVIFPHGDLMAPPALGKVVDAETLDPLPGAKVVRRIEKLDRNRVTLTDAQGEFAFKRDRDVGWILMVDYAAQRIRYSVEARGYRPFETNLYGGGSFYRGTLTHDLGLVQLHKASERIEAGPRED
jgi:hypothetical protein